MRIRTQLFVGTSALVLALVGTGWWLQIRQLRAVERELAEVAASVGIHLLQAEGRPSTSFVWTSTDTTETSILQESHRQGDGRSRTVIEKRILVQDLDPNQPLPVPGLVHSGSFQKFDVKVESSAQGSRPKTLIIKGPPGLERRVPLPPDESSRIVGATLKQGLLASALLLLAGLALAAIVAQRLSAPLRRLASGAEAIGRGELGTKVDLEAAGELGELLRAFNRMSTRLAELEAEKQAWRDREHLAELGDLARGLGHTLRNPLHTLGLAVEELASRGGAGADELGSTARGQIRRIDGWLRSFLSIGAGGSAEPQRLDLVDLARDVALEAIQQGANLELYEPDEALPVQAVGPALRAALSNLVGNALEAAPAGSPVGLSVLRDAGFARIEIADSGEGLAEEVRKKLFSPHVTTKTGGAGMGLFLAKQLIEGGHRGRLEIHDRPEGGTLAVVRIPLAEDPA